MRVCDSVTRLNNQGNPVMSSYLLLIKALVAHRRENGDAQVRRAIRNESNPLDGITDFAHAQIRQRRGESLTWAIWVGSQLPALDLSHRHSQCDGRILPGVSHWTRIGLDLHLALELSQIERDAIIPRAGRSDFPIWKLGGCVSRFNARLPHFLDRHGINQRSAFNSDAVLWPMRDCHFHRESQNYLVAGLEHTMQNQETLVRYRRGGDLSVHCQQRRSAPSWNPQREWKLDWAGRIDREKNPILEGEISGLNNLNLLVIRPNGCVYLRGAIKNCRQTAVTAFHPHTDCIVGKNAMNISSATSGSLPGVRLIGHPAAARLRPTAVGVESRQELVGAREILE